MDQKTLIKFGAIAIAGLAAATAASAATTSWTGAGDGTSWTDSGNWGAGTEYPGQNQSDVANIDNGDTVTYSSGTLPFAILTDVTGGSTLNFTGGTINSTTGTNDISGSGSTMTVSGGNWVLNGNNNLRIYSDGVLNVSSGSVGFGSVGYYVLGSTAANAYINLSGTASFGDSNTNAYFGDGSGANAVFTLTGSGVTTGGRDLYVGATKAGGASTLAYVADSSGVSAFNSTFKMQLTSSHGSAGLSVDLSALAPGTGTITLADYGSLIGSFGTTNIFSGATTLSAGSFGSLSEGEYAIDYAGAGGTIQLQYNVVPEPGTYALLAGLFGLGYVMLRRRKA